MKSATIGYLALIAAITMGGTAMAQERRSDAIATQADITLLTTRIDELERRLDSMGVPAKTAGNSDTERLQGSINNLALDFVAMRDALDRHIAATAKKTGRKPKAKRRCK